MSHHHYPSHPPSRRSSDPERQPRISGWSGYTTQNSLVNPGSHERLQSSSSSVPSGLPDAYDPSSLPAGDYSYIPEHAYGPLPTSSATSYYGYPQGMVAPYPGPSESPGNSSPPGSSVIAAFPPSQPGYQDELAMLRRQVRELTRVNEAAHARIHQLERGPTQNPSSSAGPASLPSAPHTPNVSPNFEASWRARTDARVRQFCALNRAGNALCAWHETRRERRAYPPRAAPPGVLNCGCTYEEALFEESLSRHDIGAYYPGEKVRMDPVLRNPLLRLLQARYGYRDGDFERDPTTGAWLENEGPLFWEQRALLGVTTRRRGDTQ